MKSLSIKGFAFLIVFFVILIESFVFYTFFDNSKLTISKLLESSIQTDTLNLRHFMEKGLKYKNINNISAHVDNIIIINPIIKDINILDNHQNLIYHPNIRNKVYYNNKEKCISIAKISATNIFHQQCYSFPVKTFHGLQTIYYYAHVYIDTDYINNLIAKKAETISLMFF